MTCAPRPIKTTPPAAAGLRIVRLVLRTKSGIREHPALRCELASRSFCVRTLARLGLDYEPVKAVGRPPSAYGFKGYE